MSQIFDVKNNPRWKRQEFFSFVTTADNNSFDLSINSLVPIDRIRITLFMTMVENLSDIYGIKAYTNIIDNWVGVPKQNSSIIIDNGVIYTDKLEPEEGLNFVYYNKVLLQGTYYIKLFKLDGSAFTDDLNVLNVLVEYFVDL